MVSKIFFLALLLARLIILILGLKIISGFEIVWEWSVASTNTINFIILVVFDWISLIFFSVVILISARVYIYSRSYIATEKFFSRFLLLVLLFICRIALLIFRPNFVSILLGWDGLGVTSYLLVIYYQREKSFNAGIVTALTNRLGDASILCLIGLIAQNGTWSFLYLSNIFENKLRYLVIFLALLAAITKRAQIPFSAWLPAAIAAPTPVSSLVHSSTLVTAGVYLLIRINYILSRWKNLDWLIFLGCITIIIAGFSALSEVDIKKVIALSTLRQLGLMFFSLGLGIPLFSFFHLIAHAYFKAMLFICAGGVIHIINEYQDLRSIGRGIYQIPISCCIFFVANLSLCGIPFIRGFYSKDLILEILIIKRGGIFIMLLSIIATGITVAYSCRIIKLIFFNISLFRAENNLVERDKTILLGIRVLLVPSLIGGLIFSWLIISNGNLVFLPFWIKISVLTIVLLRGVKFLRAENSNKTKTFLNSFFHYIWFLPWLFRSSFSFRGIASSKKIFLIRENGWRFIIAKVNKRAIRKLANYRFQRVLSYFLKRLSIIFLLIFIL